MAGVSDAGTLESDASAEEREAAVHDVIQTIARTTFDLDAVCQTVIDRAVRLCRADTGNIARRDGDTDEYRIVGSRPATRRSAGLGSRGATSTARSAMRSSSPHG
jgi:hypothetical protein